MAQSRPFILRTPDGSLNDMPPDVRHKIELLGIPTSGVQSIQGEEKHRIHFERRLNALDKGAKLLLDSLDIQGEARKQISKKLDDIHQACTENLYKLSTNEPSIDPFQNYLASYTKQLKEILVHDAVIPKKEVNHALSRAEEYANMAEGRPSLCTVTPINDGAEWMVQLEIPQDPLSEEKKEEFLNVIRHKEESNDEYKLPEWFTIMPQTEKDLFLTTFKDAKNTNDIAAKASTISSKLRSIPGVANFSRHIFMVMDNKGEIKTEDHRLRSSMISSRDLPKDATGTRHEFTEHNAQQIIDAMLEEQVKKQVARLGDKATPETILTIPVLMQTLITPFKEPDKSLFADKEAIIARLKTNNRRKVKVNNVEYQVDLELISTNHPLNPGRFVTPTVALGNLPVESSEETPTTGFIFANQAADEISDLVNFSKAFTTTIREIKGVDNELCKKIDIAANALNTALQRSAIVSDRELYISALEELTTSLIGGISYGSCVSGKDRKGLETMYADAMRLYFDRTNEIPPMSWANNTEKAKRAEFVKIFTDIYVTRHQHENAGQNAPGADGIKTPHLYLPNDILTAIAKRTKNPNIHEECDRLASNNEIDKIKFKVGKLNQVKQAVQNVGVKIGGSVSSIFSRLTNSRKEAVEVLKKNVPHALDTKPHPITQEEEKTIQGIHGVLLARSSLTAPTGIKKMLDLFEKKTKAGQNPSLLELGQICRGRFDTNSKRTSETKQIYEMVINLARNLNSERGNSALKTFQAQNSSAQALRTNAKTVINRLRP